MEVRLAVTDHPGLSIPGVPGGKVEFQLSLTAKFERGESRNMIPSWLMGQLLFQAKEKILLLSSE